MAATEVKNLKEYNDNILSDLHELTNPFYQQTGINLLTFRRLFPDGRIIHIANDKAWLNQACEHGFWQSSSSLSRIFNVAVDHQYSHVWGNDAYKDDVVYNAMYEGNHWHGLTLYDRREDFVDLWAFATGRDNHMALDFYVNNMKTLKEFILFMQDRGRKLLLQEDNELSVQTKNSFSLNQTNSPKSQPIPGQMPSRYYYGPESHEYLTCSQYKCLSLISRGFVIKDIANQLHLSPRTVECHLNSIKDKLAARGRRTLLDKARYLLNMSQ